MVAAGNNSNLHVDTEVVIKYLEPQSYFETMLFLRVKMICYPIEDNFKVTTFKLLFHEVQWVTFK